MLFFIDIWFSTLCYSKDSVGIIYGTGTLGTVPVPAIGYRVVRYLPTVPFYLGTVGTGSIRYGTGYLLVSY